MSPSVLAVLRAYAYATRNKVAFYNSERCPLILQDHGSRVSDYYAPLELVRKGF